MPEHRRGSFPGLTDIHAHPAMNAFLWDRDLRRHYFTGKRVQPAGQPHRLQDARAGRREGAVVVAARPRARATSRCLPIRIAAHFTSGGRMLLKQDAWDVPAAR